jgi:ribonuclease VapC
VIVVDTSALKAIFLEETEAEGCSDRIITEDIVLISTATLAETLIVAMRKNVENDISAFVYLFQIQVEPVTESLARKAAEAYRTWGKGRNPAGLNYGDCFSYALAKDINCPLLFVGDDFSKTDVAAA